MLNKYIQKQLEELGIFEEGKYEYDIERVVPITFSIGHYYRIEVEDYIVNPGPQFTLHQQWNNNIKPSTCKMFVVVLQLQTKMVKVGGVCSDNTEWEGWLPIKSITHSEEVECK